MADKTLTAANSVYILTVRGLFAQQQLQGYATDAAWETEAPEMAEVVKGVDGKLSAGFVPFITSQTISLQADSDSNLLFEQWTENMKRLREVMYADAVIILPAVQRKYQCTKGVLMAPTPLAAVRKTLQPRTFRIQWDDVSPAPF